MVTDYKIIKSPINAIELAMKTAIADGWQPWGNPVILEHADTTIMQEVVKIAEDEGEDDESEED